MQLAMLDGSADREECPATAMWERRGDDEDKQLKIFGLPVSGDHLLLDHGGKMGNIAGF